MIKRLFAGALALILCLALTACSMIPPQETAADTSASETSDKEASKPSDPSKPQNGEASSDLESVKVGKHVTLRYNANAVDITCEVKKGVGSKENVSVTATPKNGYTFDGFTVGNAIANGKSPVTVQTTYSFTASEATQVFVNSSFRLTYHENGGQRKSGFDGTDTFSAVFYLNPNTLHDDGSFFREGYTLVGYNTKEDGSGETVSLGSRVNAHGKGTLELWCVWEENTPADQFTYAKESGGIAIVKYNGSAETVTIPEVIDGQPVFKISSDAFLNNNTVKRIVVAKSISIIAPNAFHNCSVLEDLIIFDRSIRKISDDCFKDCSASLHINSVYALTNEWFSWSAAKFDRLMWAKDKKKIIIVGGSGSFEGFNGETLDHAFAGEYEIVNLGENANITSLMYFDIIEEFVMEGDIVLWCPEVGGPTLGNDVCHQRFWEYRKADYGFMQYLDLSYYSNIFSAFSDNCLELASASFKSYDQLSAEISKYGDYLLDRDSKGELYSYSFTASPSSVEALSELFGSITQKGAKIFFSFAAMQESGAKKADKAQVDAYEKRITALPGVVSISKFEDCLYEDKYFYDSPWHMTDEGAILRSERVAEDLFKALEKND